MKTINLQGVITHVWKTNTFIFSRWDSESLKRIMPLIALAMQPRQSQGGEENGRVVWKYKGKFINEIEAEEI